MFVLALVTLVLYWPAMHHGFVYDDLVALVPEASFRLGLTRDGFTWAFTAFHSGNWYPLTLLSHLLDVQLFGFRPGPHHAMSILIHATNSALLFLLLRRLTGAVTRSALVATLFAVHPLHVESVAWVSERKDVLCALFWLLAMGAYLRYSRQRSWPRYLLVCVATALALLSKPMAVTLPFALLLLDFWPLGRLRLDSFSRARRSRPTDLEAPWSVILEKFPLLVLAAAAGALAIEAQHSARALAAASSHPLALRLANALLSCLRYVGKTLWPLDLTALYTFPIQGLSAPATILPGFVLALATAACLWNSRRLPALAMGWLWFLGTLVPVIGLVQVGSQAMADRYTYLPHIGLFTGLVWATHDIVQNRFPAARRVPGVIVALTLPILFTLAHRQLAVWENNWTLFEQMVRVDSGNWVAQTELGLLLTEQGRVEEGIARYRASLAANPEYAYTPFNLATALLSIGRTREAEELYRRTIQLDPGLAEAWYNLGVILQKQGRIGEANSFFQHALRLKPTLAVKPAGTR